MPVFNNPRQAIIVEGGDSALGLVALLVCVGVGIAALITFVVAHAVLITACLVVFVVVVGGFAVWCRWVTSERRYAAARAPLPPPPVHLRRALAPPPRAIEPARVIPAHVEYPTSPKRSADAATADS